MELKLLLIIFTLHCDYYDVQLNIQVKSLTTFLSPLPLPSPSAWQYAKIHPEFQAYSDWHVLCSPQHHHLLPSCLLSPSPSVPLLSLFFSSWMWLIRDWHARGAALTQLPWLLRQQPRMHLLHPDAAWQRHSATSTGLQAGGGRHAQSEGLGGVVASLPVRLVSICVCSGLISSHSRSVPFRSLMAAVIRLVCWGCLQAASC